MPTVVRVRTGDIGAHADLRPPEPPLAAAGAVARPLRILYHHRIAASDGMRVHVRELVEALRARGCVVQVVGPGGSEAEQAAGEHTRLERMADTARARLPRAIFELAELAYNGPAGLRLARAARTFRPDVIYERCNLFLLAGLAYAARSGVPLLLEVNSPLAAEREATGQLALKTFGRRCERALWRGADAVLPVSEVLARTVRQVRGGTGVHVIPNGANLDRRPTPEAVTELRRALGLDPGTVVLGFCGFVRSWHGVRWAIEALPGLPHNVALVVVGDGPALPELAAAVAQFGLEDRVRLVGRVPHEAVAPYLGSFDVALQTAATPYASPLKLFEYMALGRAIVAPDQPNIREVLAHGENALLFQPGDEAGFRLALAALVNDRALRARIGAAAARTVEEAPFTWAHNAERIEAVARQLVRAAVSRERVTDFAASQAQPALAPSAGAASGKPAPPLRPRPPG